MLEINRKLVSVEVRKFLFSVLSRENLTVAITIFCIVYSALLTLWQSRMDLMTFQIHFKFCGRLRNYASV